MGVKEFKPTTSTLRGTKLEDRSMLEKDSGPKSLTVAKKQKSGRNNQGRITVRHRGGGYKRRVRKIDFKRDKFGIEAKVLGLYFDPNRSAHLALLQYADGEKRYIIAPRGIMVGSKVISNDVTDILPGNAMRIKNIPSGTIVHCVESKVGMGATFGRSAGQAIVVQGIDPTGKYVQIKMPSGEIRKILSTCKATIGSVGNSDHALERSGKAGRSRWLGRRPRVRGVAMNPVDHPMGGGEGRASGGHPRSRKGLLAKGYRTRRPKNQSNQYIIERRKK